MLEGVGRIMLLAFADDVMLVTETKKQMEELCSRCAELTKEAGMEINFSKSDYLTSTDDLSPLQCSVQGKPFAIPCVAPRDAFRYLGIWFDKDLDMQINADKLVARIKNRMDLLMQARPPLKVAIGAINECVTPILQYVAKNAALSKATLDRIRRV